MEFKKKKVTLTNGESYAYIEQGQGDTTLLLVHGNMSSGVHYYPLLSRLPADIHALSVDLRGFGDSSYKKSFDTLHDLADDLKDFITKKKLKTPLAVAGWSAGGGVVLSLASRYPELVDKVILINSMSYRGLPIYEKDEKGGPILTAPYKTKAEMALDPIQVLPLVNALKNKDLAFMNYIWELAIYNVNKPTPEHNAIYMAETFKQKCLVDLDWALTQFNIGVGQNYSGIEGDKSMINLTAKVLSLYGLEDKTVPEFMVRETVGALAKKARLVTYKKAGHSPLVDVPDELAQDILNFLAE